MQTFKSEPAAALERPACKGGFKGHCRTTRAGSLQHSSTVSLEPLFISIEPFLNIKFGKCGEATLFVEFEGWEVESRRLPG